MFTDLQQAYEESIRCIRCGYCLTTCPTFVLANTEHSVARGRNFLTRLIYEQKADLSKNSKTTIFECLLCGACIDNCASNVLTPQIMMATRQEFNKEKGQPAIQKFVFRELLLHPKRFTRAMKLAALGKRTHISNLAQALKIFSWIGKNIATMEDLLKSLPAKFLRERAEEVSQPGNPRELKVGYFVGCGINFAYPDVGMATLKVLTKNNFQTAVLENYCCGLPASGYGDLEAAKEMARKNIEIFEQSKCDVILTECGSCSSFLREYDTLLKDDPEWKERAQKAVEKIQDINIFLTEQKLMTKFKLKYGKTVTYHDPCHLSHYQKITSQPRELIQQIEGIQFKEMNEANWCCGGAGTYNVAHPDLSIKILHRKMENVDGSEAEILLTSCPGCMVQLAYGARKFSKPIEVKHIVQVLAESME
ncbi:MAG: (Fe-S)-binding protein [Calditrichaeota bacterium]|nr:(Fe-S)-binding protein [Calditrichota bacterium]